MLAQPPGPQQQMGLAQQQPQPSAPHQQQAQQQQQLTPPVGQPVAYYASSPADQFQSASGYQAAAYAPAQRPTRPTTFVQQQPQQALPVRHQQAQQYATRPPPSPQQQQPQQPNQSHNFNPSVNLANQVQQQQTISPADPFGHSPTLLQQQLSRQQPRPGRARVGGAPPPRLAGASQESQEFEQQHFHLAPQQPQEAYAQYQTRPKQRPRQQQQQVIVDQPQQQQQQFACNPTPPLTPNARPLASASQPDDWPQAQAYAPSERSPLKHRIMPKSQQQHQQHQLPPIQHQQHYPPPAGQHQVEPPRDTQVRLTLPLRDAVLVGPFKLEHGAQFTSKHFHLRPQLYETLSRSALQQQQQTGAVVQELQFRAYLSEPAGRHGDSLLATPSQPRPPASNACNWPDLFQVSCNQQLVHLERGTKAHRAADLFAYCQPGDNLLELQVNDCYCSHEFVLELVDRPTLRAFMNSCFKSRLLSHDSCLAKLRALFGAPASLVQLPAAAIHNEYLTDFAPPQPNAPPVEQTRVRLSLRCALSGRRLRTPARGPNCKHLQCFDLENFLVANRERTRWHCPLCAAPVPFNMLELDQHQLTICQSLASSAAVDEVLVDPLGQWQPYQPAPVYSSLPRPAPSTAKANGTFHPGAPPIDGAPVARPPLSVRPTGHAQALGSPAHWDQQQPVQVIQQAASPPATLGPLRRQPAGGRRSVGPSASKRAYAPAPFAGQQQPQAAFYPQQQQQQQHQMEPAGVEAELSPLAAMERTIIHHAQQMGPPPFDANVLSAPAGSLSSLNSSPIGRPPASAPLPHNQHHKSPSSGFSTAHHGHSQQRASPSDVPIGQPQVICASPARQLPVSPSQVQHQQQAGRSPGHQQAPLATQLAPLSTPATPLVQGAPETPATPAGSGCATSQTGQQQAAVDQQPLSNGSASAASIGSSSTLTPGGQSLGSVGMGGDSRCNTAPLTSTLGSLDDLAAPAGCSASQLQTSTSPYNKSQQSHHLLSHNQQQQQQQQQSAGSFCHLAEQEKSEILMNKLMMEADGERPGAELALALEEAEWKQQLDSGKSEHLANFLNEPMMLNKKQQQFAAPAQQLGYPEGEGAHRMLSGGLNPSDDEAANPHESSLDLSSPQLDSSEQQQQQQHQFQLAHDPYACYLDASGTDDGAGLPPDDSILDLFER